MTFNPIIIYNLEKKIIIRGKLIDHPFLIILILSICFFFPLLIFLIKMHIRQTKSKQITRIIKHKVLDEISSETWFPFPETNSKFQNHEIVSTNLSSNYKFRNIARARAHTHTNSEINIFTLRSLRSSRSSLNDSPLARETGWLSMIGDERREGKKKEGGGLSHRRLLPRFRTKEEARRWIRESDTFVPSPYRKVHDLVNRLLELPRLASPFPLLRV